MKKETKGKFGSNTNLPKLGTVVFVVDDKGNITRTSVSSIKSSGGYDLFNGQDNRTLHFFEYKHAVVEAVRLIEAREASLVKELGELKANIKQLTTHDMEVEGLSSSITAVNLGVLSGNNSKKPPVFDETNLLGDYFEPGQIVYALIAPDTHNIAIPHYRPYKYFVLEVLIERVSINLRGWVSYSMSSHFYVRNDQLFSSIDTAKAELVEVFSKETGGVLDIKKVQFCSMEECKKNEKKIFDDISDRVKGALSKA